MSERMSDRYTQHARNKLTESDYRNQNYYDDHHLCFNRAEWETRPAGLYIRQNIIARGMSRVVHNVLHVNSPAVPVPNIHTLQRVANDLIAGQDVLSAVDQYCLLVDRDRKHPRIKPLEVKLNDLSIEAIRGQLDYTRECIRRER